MENPNCRARVELFKFFAWTEQLFDLGQVVSPATVVGLFSSSTSQRNAPGCDAIRSFQSLVQEVDIGGGECRALSSQLCSAEKPPAHLSSGSFRGPLLKSISTRERRYSQRVSLQMPFMAFLRVLYAFTNCCRTEGVRFWHLRYLAISSECRSLTGITFRPTQLARWPCAVFHATTLQNSFNPAPASCGY